MNITVNQEQGCKVTAFKRDYKKFYENVLYNLNIYNDLLCRNIQLTSKHVSLPDLVITGMKLHAQEPFMLHALDRDIPFQKVETYWKLSNIGLWDNALNAIMSNFEYLTHMIVSKDNTSRKIVGIDMMGNDVSLIADDASLISAAALAGYKIDADNELYA